MSKHTKGLLISGQYSSVVGMPIVGQLGTIICNMATMPVEHPHHKEINEIAQANAERLTECWNALAGVEDPEGLRNMLDKWAELKRNNRPAQITEQLILQHLKGGNQDG